MRKPVDEGAVGPKHDALFEHVLVTNLSRHTQLLGCALERICHSTLSLPLSDQILNDLKLTFRHTLVLLCILFDCNLSNVLRKGISFLLGKCRLRFQTQAAH